jgi:hypothetical protein
MAGGLTLPRLSLGAPRHRKAALALVLTVIVLHVFVTREVMQRMAEFATPQAMPPRIQVAYVRELELAPPPQAAPVVVAQKPPRPRAAAAPTPAAAAASAPMAAAEPLPPAVPEPIPAPVAEAALPATP